MIQYGIDESCDRNALTTMPMSTPATNAGYTLIASASTVLHGWRFVLPIAGVRMPTCIRSLPHSWQCCVGANSTEYKHRAQETCCTASRDVVRQSSTSTIKTRIYSSETLTRDQHTRRYGMTHQILHRPRLRPCRGEFDRRFVPRVPLAAGSLHPWLHSIAPPGLYTGHP